MKVVLFLVLGMYRSSTSVLTHALPRAAQDMCGWTLIPGLGYKEHCLVTGLNANPYKKERDHVHS